MFCDNPIEVHKNKKDELNQKVLEYLKENSTSFIENKSTLYHFYSPLIFYNLLTVKNVDNDKSLFMISSRGKVLLKNYKEKNIMMLN